MYHIPISLVRGDVGNRGEKINGERERRRRESRLIKLTRLSALAGDT